MAGQPETRVSGAGMIPIDDVDHYRPLLFAIAYRMLGGVADAEDAVQETLLRWHRERGRGTAIQSPKGWLTTTLTRLCLDELRSARVQRETYVGPWLPEPLVSEAEPDVAEAAVLAESLSTAFLVLLETLNPRERAVFLLHDVFAFEYAAIREIVGISEDGCRQMARRARARIVERRPRFDPAPDQQERLVAGFLRACADGDVPTLIASLAEDVTIWSDGGAKSHAARRPILGRDKVARFLLGLLKLAPAGLVVQRTRINGQPGLVSYVDSRPLNAVTIVVDGDAIQALYIVVNPDKLQSVPPLGEIASVGSSQHE